jgi:hypothetical protein
MKVTELRVTEVFENSYAASLGIEVGDVLITLKGVKLLSIAQLIATIESNSGNPVTYGILRGDIDFLVRAKAFQLGLMINNLPVITRVQEFDVSDETTNDELTPYGNLKRETESIEASNNVIVTDIQMPFGSMVVFMVKWILASIPAMIILAVLFGIVTSIFSVIAV